MQNDRRPFVIPLLVAIAASLALGAPAAFAADRERYIVVLKDSVDAPGEVAREHAGRFAGELGYVYRHALKGYSAKLPAPAVSVLERDPRVRFVSRDHRMTIAAQSIPTGIRRTFAADSPYLDIDGQDDFRVDADVAVIDTGIDYDHPDLNVVARTICPGSSCTDNAGDDGHGHGTHVAGTVGAIDNGTGVVGIAPGARLWAVKVLDDGGFDWESSIVAGVNWVTARASQIEVANMSIRCVELDCVPSALNVAIGNSVDAGVVYAVAAGNQGFDAFNQSPANNPDVITVSALVDYDGLPGGLGNATCIGDVDDTLAGFSNWGAAVEVAAPGVCILSTWKNGGYHTISGTSMASPHVAGAAAWLASQNNPATRAGVEAIRQKIIDAGNFDWIDDSGDGIKEPLLDVRWPISPTTEFDVDGDGRAELVNLDSFGFARVRGTDGSASTDLGVGLALLDGRGSYAIDVADVTGDGQSDLVTWGNAGGVSVHRGTLDKKFASPVAALSGWNPSWDGEAHLSSEPIGVADVNGDGRADLVTAWNYIGNGLYSLTTHLGQAAGTFNSLEFVTEGFTVDSALFDNVGEYLLDAADVDGDGRADVVSLGTSGSARVYRGQADGYFAAPVTAASINPVLDDGQGEEPVGLADVDLDGRADLVTLDGSGALKLYKGKADATFEAAVSAYAGTIDSSLLDGTGRELVGLLDYNGDGRADLVAIDDGGALWTYAAQAATPTFANPTSGYGFHVVRTFGRGAAISAPYSRAELATERPIQRRPGCKPSGCAWRSAPTDSDVNGDGRAELVTIEPSGSSFYPRSYVGTDSGVLTDMSALRSTTLDPPPALLDGVGSYVVDVSDVTGDGQSDLVTWGNAGGVAVRHGTYDGSFSSQPVAALSGWNPSWDGEAHLSSEPIGVADVNGDGRADLVTAWNYIGNGLYSLTTHLGQAAGTFNSLEFVTEGFTVDSALFDNVGEYLLDAADVDGDGRADVVSLGTSGSARVYKGKTDSTFAAPVTAASINPVLDDGQGEEPVGLADVNLDGRADLVTLDGSGALKLYKGKADATFEAAVSAYAGTIDSSLLDGTGRELVGLLDYNRDGRADLVAIDEQGQVWNYRAQPDATFATPTSGGSATQNWAPTVRIHGATGDEPAFEKNIQRRVGCSTSGCTWPPTP